MTTNTHGFDSPEKSRRLSQVLDALDSQESRSRRFTNLKTNALIGLLAVSAVFGVERLMSSAEESTQNKLETKFLAMAMDVNNPDASISIRQGTLHLNEGTVVRTGPYVFDIEASDGVNQKDNIAFTVGEEGLDIPNHAQTQVITDAGDEFPLAAFTTSTAVDDQYDLVHDNESMADNVFWVDLAGMNDDQSTVSYSPVENNGNVSSVQYNANQGRFDVLDLVTGNIVHVSEAVLPKE